MASITKNVHVKMPIADVGTIFDSQWGRRTIRIYGKNTVIIGFDTSTLTNFKSLLDFTFGWDTTPLFYFVSVRYYDTSNNLQQINNDGLTLAQFQSELSIYFNTDIEWYLKTTFDATDLDDFFEDLEYYHMLDLSENYILKFRANSPKNMVDKDLIFVGSEPIQFTRPITYKKLIIDRETLIDEPKFNYVYISILNRYYFVDDMSMTNKMCSMVLSEDVLMSFSDLIKSQTAFVKRNEFTYHADIVDEELYTDYDKVISYTSISETTSLFIGSTYDEANKRNFIITVVG